MRSIILFILLFLNVQAYAQVLTPDESIPVDVELVESCVKIVDDIESIELKCDTVSFEALSSQGDILNTSDGALIYDLEEIYFDKNKRLRKYFNESFVRDGENSHVRIAAYYDEKGHLIYITFNGDSHCDAINEYFYIHNERIIDFMSEYDCECCDEEETEEEVDNARFLIGSSALSETIGWGTSLADFIHTDTLLSLLSGKEDRENDAF